MATYTYTYRLMGFYRPSTFVGTHIPGYSSADLQVSSLLYAMGQESETIMRTFALTEVGQKNFDTVTSKFDCYFRPKVNYIENRVAFQQRAQKHESIEQFIRALYEIAENCNYETREYL